MIRKANLLKRIETLEERANQVAYSLERLQCSHEYTKWQRKERQTYISPFDVSVASICEKCGHEKLRNLFGLSSKEKEALIALGILYEGDFPKPKPKPKKQPK